MIIAGSTSQALAAELASETGDALASVTTETFPDGERYVRIDDTVRDEEVLIVASTVSAGSHIELLQLQDAAREAGAETVMTIIPYMGYARQDRAFEVGEPVSARAVARAISTGSDRVVTVNPHESAICEYFDVPATAVDAAGVLAEPLPELTDPLFISPDEGAIDLATTLCENYGTGDTDFFVKTRNSADSVNLEPSDANVSDRDVVLVDDIIATGSTMSEAVTLLDGRGANRVFVTCVHPLLARTAYTKLSRAGVQAIYGTDTIERTASRVSVAPAIVDVL